ncbi:FUSC family protein [Kitasatospora sp. NPDC050543]|uniref:FUSC family protein n=1 Tax=Kitasatospora sp. NPDC050543 TaxID=3364054 RepID=UPI0037946A2C
MTERAGVAEGRPGPLAPPQWLTRTLHVQPLPVPRAAAARAAVGMALPVAVGAATGQIASGALVSMGALGAVIGDTADAYRLRVLHIGVPQLVGAAGLALGERVYGHGWAAVAALTALALVAGMISTIGAVASAAGLSLMLLAIIGAGLPMPTPWWRGPALVLLGTLLVLAMALLAWPRRARVPERSAVAAAYRVTAELLAAAGTERWEQARAPVTQSLNHAYDLLLGRRAVAPGRSRGMSRLVALLNAVTVLLEAAPAVQAAGRPLPPHIPQEVRAIADAVEGGPAPPDTVPPLPADPAERAVEAAVRHAREVLAGAHWHADRLGRPPALPARLRSLAHDLLLTGNPWRQGVRLALCVGLAQALVSLVPVPRSYWVPLTVVLVLKPDFGSVFSRAVLRSIGTAAGLVVAAVALAVVPRGGWEVPVVAVLAAALPVVSRRNYALQTAVITPLILIFTDLLGHQGVRLVAPRMLDDLIGCAIVLLAGYALWPESWHTRVGARLAAAVDDTARYVECAFAPAPGSAGAWSATGPGRPAGGTAPGAVGGGSAGSPLGTAASAADQAARARLRRRVYRDVSVVRTEFQRALGEPPPVGARAAAWWPLLVAVERVIEATTAAAVHAVHGAPAPAPAETARIAAELRELTHAIRTGTPLPPTEPGRERGGEASGHGGDGGGDDGAPVLAALHREVRAAHAVLTGPAGGPPPADGR